jgi:hypothetical protein
VIPRRAALHVLGCHGNHETGIGVYQRHSLGPRD